MDGHTMKVLLSKGQVWRKPFHGLEEYGGKKADWKKK